MTDPISPTGSPGQLPLVVPGSPSPSPVPAGEGTATSTKKAVSAQILNEDLVQIAVKKTMAPKQAKDARPSISNLEDAIKTLREYIQKLPSDLQFKADNESGYIICKVVNPVTREVIRQYPPEELVELAHRLRSLEDSGSNSGALLDKEL